MIDVAMGFFDISIGGFWRSFFAAAIVAPIYIIIVSLRTLEGAAEVSFAWLFVVEIIRYGFDWVIRIEQGKGRKDRYAMLSEPLLDLLRAWWLAGRALRPSASLQSIAIQAHAGVVAILARLSAPEASC